MKLNLYFFLILIASNSGIQAQNLQLKWESDSAYIVGLFAGLDNDGGRDIFYKELRTSSEIKIFDGSTYSLRYTLPSDEQTISYAFYSPPTFNRFIDWNGDGLNDIMSYGSNIASGYIKVIDLNNSNNIILELNDPNYVLWPEYLGDIDNDNIIDLAVMKTTLNYDFYKLAIYSTGVISSSNNENPDIVQNFSLDQNYPNPFNPSTTIRYTITSPENVSIRIFDISGQLVKVINKEHSQAGVFEVIWNGANNFGEKVSSGAYFYQLSIGDYNEAKKMIMLK